MTIFYHSGVGWVRTLSKLITLIKEHDLISKKGVLLDLLESLILNLDPDLYLNKLVTDRQTESMAVDL